MAPLAVVLVPLLALNALAFVAPPVSFSSATAAQDGVSLDDFSKVGAGIGDITGPPLGVEMMGYASPTQYAKGIHHRLFARAYIFGSESTRVVFASLDIGMTSQPIKRQVVERLQAIYGPDLYTERNVLISGTHTHSGPAGYLQYILFQVMSLGYLPESTDAIVEGTVNAIVRAHESLTEGTAAWTLGRLENASRSRSPSSYLANPPAERALYGKDDTDKEVVQLAIQAKDGREVGAINWFSVHPVSMNNTNTYISGDNKGHAAYLFEKMKNKESMPYSRMFSRIKKNKETPFVAAFAQSCPGDVTPNVLGAFCFDSDVPCDGSCPNEKGEPRVEGCIGRGPGYGLPDDQKDFVSTQVIGQRQFNAAVPLYEAALQEIAKGGENVLRGPVQYAHQWLDIPSQTVTVDGEVVKMCKPAMGYSFAAGTTDGPGALDFQQGDNSTVKHPFWDRVRSLIHKPSKELKACQYPKPVLLATGETNIPYPWHPHIVDTQVLRIGQLFILAVPAEFTTMSGRRIRKAVRNALLDLGLPESTRVVVAGLSNTYTHYVATPEEYMVQRYEGASTIFGPNSLNFYIKQFTYLATSIARGERVSPVESQPKDLTKNALQLIPPVDLDTVPIGKHYGGFVEDVLPNYRLGETVTVRMYTGHPRTNPLREKFFMLVERLVGSSWEVVADDHDFETRIHFDEKGVAQRHLEMTAQWFIPRDEELRGTYRIRLSGTAKLITGKKSHEGITKTFNVV